MIEQLIWTHLERSGRGLIKVLFLCSLVLAEEGHEGQDNRLPGQPPRYEWEAVLTFESCFYSLKHELQISNIYKYSSCLKENYRVFSLFFFLGVTTHWLYFHSPVAGFSLLVFEVSSSHKDAPQSVGFLWTSDQPVAEISTWQHTTLTTNIHAPGGIRTHNLGRRAAEDLRLRPGGHWDRHRIFSTKINYRVQFVTSIAWSH